MRQTLAGRTGTARGRGYEHVGSLGFPGWREGNGWCGHKRGVETGTTLERRSGWCLSVRGSIVMVTGNADILPLCERLGQRVCLGGIDIRRPRIDDVTE